MAKVMGRYWRMEIGNEGRQNMHIVWFERAEKLGGTLKCYLTFLVPYRRGDINYLFLAGSDVS